MTQKQLIPIECPAKVTYKQIQLQKQQQQQQ